MEASKSGEKKRESTIDVLKRLKSQEAKPSAKLEYYGPRNPLVIDKYEEIRVEPPKARNIPEQRIISIINEIDRIEKKMRDDSSNYLSWYYDLNKQEDRFLKEVDMIERQNLEISNQLKAQIEARKKQIMAKMRIQKELSEIKRDYS